jgi:hypothetical protein
MPRIRSLKPDFFEDEDLAEIPFWVRLLFQGLWCMADKAGRLEDRPLKLKARIFPYEKVDVEAGLCLLAEQKKHSPRHFPFIVRYEVNGERYIQILTWNKHQNPHHTERESEIPGFNGDLTVREPLGKGGVGDEQEQGTMNLSHIPETRNHDPIDLRLTQLLIDLMQKNNPESSTLKHLTEKKQTDWMNQCRLLREADNRTEADIEKVIRFSQGDSFWKNNVLSMPKLREKWDTLWMKAGRTDGWDQDAWVKGMEKRLEEKKNGTI